VLGGNSLVLGALLVLWGVAGTVANLTAGRIIDSIGSGKVIFAMLAILVVDFALMPWSGAHIATAAIAIAVWGVCGWGLMVPQQHRLVDLSPTIAPVLLGLNSTCISLGVTTAGLLGAMGIKTFGAHNLGLLGAVLLTLALIVSELAAQRISASRMVDTVSVPASV